MPSIIVTALLYLFHPFYVSVTEIKHNPQTKNVELSIRVFFDDFEKSLSHQYKSKVNILKPTDRKQVDALIADYVSRHLKVTADGKLLVFKYLGYEIEEDAAWCYLESPKVENIKVLRVQNDILYAEHPTQSNMIHVVVNGKRKSTKLDNPNSKAELTF